ncbi:MAG: FAD-dependent oxidoreductase [Clostridiales bacterium]|jgi:formate dehydrogenase major subunit|nr:FAD-dependent oxidoreductase [Clostridiales bacterium]
MAGIRINIDGFELEAENGASILDVAEKGGIRIPTLCHDEMVKPFGACGLCLVEAENSPRLLRACSTQALDGMVIKTASPRVIAARKTALELLLSDHAGDCRPPCVTACPGQTDCQGYVGLIANGKFKEALSLINEVIPFAASIGMVCPHPCEEKCRRGLVDEPISIAALKTFAAESSKTPVEVGSDTGKSVGVIGGGPGGLTAAYFLRKKGHSVTVYDAMEKMGGMLRYGIPEYRLPKATLDAEIKPIEDMGVKFVNNAKIGYDITFEHVRKQHDAIVTAIGAWTSAKLRCHGEDLEGVIGGIDFLRGVARGETMMTGGKVAVVGGGNTAMDASRTAVRLGASKAYLIYRRSRAEMPAEDIEIEEAAEEGVIFNFLTNPIEILGENGRVKGIRLQRMRLGEPDASGRRAPEPIEGDELTLEVDAVITAIGQGVEPKGFEALEKTRRNTICASEGSYRASMEGVFAVGDATNKGAGIAIEAIGEAKRAADVIDGYLRGDMVPYSEKYIVTRDMTADDFIKYPKMPRERAKILEPGKRRQSFERVAAVYTSEQAVREATRCLECGCIDYFECKLIKYSNELDVKPQKFYGDKHASKTDASNPFMYKNPEKCILCGLCVRACDEVMGRCSIGFTGRGFDAAISAEMEAPLAESSCVSCGQCVTVCPTGALTEVLPIKKSVPLRERETKTVCSFCGVGCKLKITTHGSLALRSLPDEGILCSKGRFGRVDMGRVSKPFVSKSDRLTPTTLKEALFTVAKKTQAVAARGGKIAVSVSDRLTNEEIYLIKKYAEKELKTDKIYCLNGVRSGLKDVIGVDAGTNGLDELIGADVILLVCPDIAKSHAVAGVKIKQAVDNGAKLILIGHEDMFLAEMAAAVIEPKDRALEAFAKAVTDLCPDSGVNGFDAFKAALADVCASDEIAAAAALYVKAKKSMIVFERNETTPEAARLIAAIAVVSGHIGAPRDGIVQLHANCNGQGLIDMGVNPDGGELVSLIEREEIGALLIFGENAPFIEFGKLEFFMVADCVMTETAEMADVVLPLAPPEETSGTYTNSSRRVQTVRAAVKPEISGAALIMALADASSPGAAFVYADERRVFDEISAEYQGYKRGSFAPVPVLTDFSAKLVLPKRAPIFRTFDNTNALYKGFIDFVKRRAM